MASKYEPLSRKLSQTLGDRIRFGFDEVEMILGFPLPASARAYAPWWANVGGSHVQAIAWMSVGWRTCQVDVPGEKVSFERVSTQSSETNSDQAPNGMAETGSAFVSDEPILLDREALRGGALRLLEDYRDEQGGTLADAAVAVLNAVALERRRALLKRFPLAAESSDVDSTDLIRAERDAR